LPRPGLISANACNICIITSFFLLQDQKIPKPKRLQEWYKKMLDKGIIERIVLDYKDIYKQALEDNLQTAAELPYFEGDFWPNVMEENIREQEQVMFFCNKLLLLIIHSVKEHFFQKD